MGIFTVRPANLDVLTATASELRKLLQNGEVSSVQLVDLYLSQIERHNHRGLKLNAMISTPPKENLLDIAKSLDDERAAGPSPWHSNYREGKLPNYGKGIHLIHI